MRDRRLNVFGDREVGCDRSLHWDRVLNAKNVSALVPS